MERYVCIHGHFYQPPRENPWLEAVELQESAHPYHDWNERITAECYAPNAAARILDSEHRIEQIVNNYARISFNFGPTLLTWLQTARPEVYRAVLAADRLSRENFSGHGSALAQAYNHMIMPLANRRDKYTQLRWGIRDFEHRFRRPPEGLWLPEAAVDIETLELMAELGITFTVLAPHQARRVRRLCSRQWQEVGDGGIDPTLPYRLPLPSGRGITLFFYDGPISQAVAFEGLLGNGERFARRLMTGFSCTRTWPQLVHIATDGETYGHHHRHGEMALAYALDYIERNKLAQITNYGEYLERYPPTHAVEIAADTSWSCAHGVERWRGDCGCHTGGDEQWNQAWREPLRTALDWLRDTLAPAFVTTARQFFKDPWDARDDYIDVILARTPASRAQFLARHAVRPLGEQEQAVAFGLMELQRHAMLMYTSCGWFFDELSRIEATQVLQYAARAMQLGRAVLGLDLEQPLLERLAAARSNLPERGDGRTIFVRYVRPAMVHLQDVAAHYAVRSLFQTGGETDSVYCYRIERKAYRHLRAGRTSLCVGQVRVRAEITGGSGQFCFGAVHLGDHNLSCGVKAASDAAAYTAMVQDVTAGFTQGDLPGVMRALDRHFGAATYALPALFRDEQRRILQSIVTTSLGTAEAAYRQIYNDQAPLMQFLRERGCPLPKAFVAAAEVVLQSDLRRAISAAAPDPDNIAALLAAAQKWQVDLAAPDLRLAWQQSLERLLAALRRDPGDLAALRQAAAIAAMSTGSSGAIDLWQAQNDYYALLQAVYPEYRDRLEADDPTCCAWLEQFTRLGHILAVRVPEHAAK